ncbi:MAG: TetR/AcrR family transcriptional regulator [Steroidobacteraceae bacterium]|jgi:AcrR family transcriptional regulator
MVYRRTSLMQERLADNRNRILVAARHLIAQGGFREASIAAVAGEVGLSIGAIYRYFPSKADLFVELLTEAVSREIQILRTIIEGPGSATERLRAAVESFASRALKGPHLAYAFIIEPTETEVEAARILYRRQFSDLFCEILRQGIRSGEFPRQSIDLSAACIVGAFTEALVRPVAPYAKPAHSRQLIKAIAEVCVRAAGAVSGSAARARRSRRRPA